MNQLTSVSARNLQQMKQLYIATNRVYKSSSTSHIFTKQKEDKNAVKVNSVREFHTSLFESEPKNVLDSYQKFINEKSVNDFERYLVLWQETVKTDENKVA
jgi:hypothetical protein